MPSPPVLISVHRLRRLLRDRDAANRDDLTGLRNLRAFKRELQFLSARFRRGQAGPFALLMVDIQGFTAVNKALGHRKANEILKRFASLLRGRVKGTDFVARFGGDEFLLIAHVKTPEQFTNLLARLKAPYVVQFERRRFNLLVHLAGALARRRGDITKLDDRVHRLLRKAKNQHVQAERNGASTTAVMRRK